jgi:cold shock CspA family protein
MKRREIGTIATYNSYAFIRPDAAERDVFAHAYQLPEGRIHRGDRVSFDFTAGQNPSRAGCAQRRCAFAMMESSTTRCNWTPCTRMMWRKYGRSLSR